jgi:CheY-like chemotaxis protein
LEHYFMSWGRSEDAMLGWDRRDQRSGRAGPPGGGYSALFGLQVLVVEDEVVAATVLEDMLADFGCTVAGVAGAVSEALLVLAKGSPVDAAILDVNLGGEKIYPVADILRERAVPFVFSTGYGPADLMERYPDCQLLHKPYRPEALAEILLGFVRSSLH